MDRFYILIVVLTMIGLISFTTAASWQRGLTGKYQYPPKDGYTCEWSECRKPGPGPRLFHVRCKKDKLSYECVYRANPHCCKAYNKNQEKYYNSLAQKSGQNRQTACDQTVLESDKLCQEIEFKRIVNKSPAGNQWCIEDNSQRRKRDADEGLCSGSRGNSNVGLITVSWIASLPVMMFYFTQ